MSIADSPALLAAALRVGNPADWAPAVRMVLSPTDTLLIPFALITVLVLAWSIERSPDARPSTGPALALVTVVGSLVKPSLLLALVPGAAAYLIVARRLDRPLAGHLARWFLVPAGVVVAWQTWFLVRGPEQFEEATIAVAPLATIRHLGLDDAGPLLISHLLVIPLALWIDRRRYLGEPAVALLLWSLVAALAILVLFDEQGPREGDGNFAKPAFVVGSLLFVVSWRFVAGHLAPALREWRSGTRPPAWVVPAVLLALTCLVAGAIGYLDAVGAVDLPIREAPR
jgi:hypothetical protein